MCSGGGEGAGARHVHFCIFCKPRPDPAITGAMVARSERFELPTLGFEVRCSIQLSYERKYTRRAHNNGFVTKVTGPNEQRPRQIASRRCDLRCLLRRESSDV